MATASRPSMPRVFISSTAEDLERFRSAAKEAVLASAMFPVMFEYFPARSDNPPLAECLKRVSETDVLVVLVAHRYGWKPAGQRGKKKQPPPSITWLECQQAVDDGHEVLAFFIGHDGEWPAEAKEEYRIARAVAEGKADPPLLADVQESVAGLKTFQQWLGNRGIRKKVQTPDELAAEIVLALKAWRDDHPEFDAPALPPGTPASPEKYLRELLETTSFIDVRGLAVGSGKAHRFPIEQLYISLRTRFAPPPRDKAEKPRGEHALGEAADVPLHAALAERRLVVIGDPGAGKTTFLRRVAAALCLTELGSVPQAAEARLGIRDKTFPIFLRCATLAAHVAACQGQNGAPADATSPAWLAHCLAAESRENSSGLDQPFFQRQLEAGRCTVLLDGLDEAPDRRQRENLVQLVERAARTLDGCRFVITSRPPADSTPILPDFAHVEIAPLSDDAVDTFLRHWCRELYGDDTAEAREHGQKLLDSLRARPEIRRVARNPVMLTALAVVDWNERRLPEQRADLYESVITWLSRSRDQRPGREKPERTVTLLQELALAMHEHPQGRQTQVPKRWAAEQVLARHFGPLPVTSESIAAAEAFLTAEELDSGIVVALGPHVRFWHLQFQEYLAARAIAGCPEAAQRTLLFSPPDKLYRPEWRELILLLAGALHKQGEAKVDDFVLRVLNGLPPGGGDLAAEARCAGLLGAVFRGLRPVGYVPTEPRYAALLERVLAIFDRQRSQAVDVQVRIAAADALAQVGDPRLELDAPGRWIPIPAGTFWMGAQKIDPKLPNYDADAEEGNWNESPVHEVTLDAFEIARFPVTVVEYRRFVEHDGYATEKYWSAGGFRQFAEPGDWAAQQEHPSRPVVHVSWYEAMAYCQWAECRLPTEAEWERAARGAVGWDSVPTGHVAAVARPRPPSGDGSYVTGRDGVPTYVSGRKYPWGNEPPDKTRLNYNGNIGAASPVGIFPRGATPEGIEDLGGNVWEWCADWKAEYPATPQTNPTGPTTGQFRVLRGGSWINGGQGVRCANRIAVTPDNRNNNLGFRVVCGVRTRIS